MASDLYRLESSPCGDRLVPVAQIEQATHAGIGLLHRLAADRHGEGAALRSERDQRGQRSADLDARLERALHQVDHAERLAAQHEQDAARAAALARKLREKNAELIREKRRLRDQLMAKYPPPPIHLRVDITREDEVYQSVLFVLDAFPHTDHLPQALAEARLWAEQRGGQLRQLRLDTVAWRAIVQVPVAG